MKHKAILYLTSLMMASVSLAHAEDIIKCESQIGNHTTRSLRIYLDEKGDYAYSASEITHAPGCSGDDPSQYKSNGILEREVYNGTPTLHFKNADINTFPTCGSSQFFEDNREGVTFIFLPAECVISKQ